MSVKTGANVCPLTEERSGSVREVGEHAVWSLSSCKPGFGVDQLRDNSTETYWQSDGQLPHLVSIQFHQMTSVSQIYIYSDYKLDESYTPSRISIRRGTHFNDLQEIDVVDLCEPSGWVCIPIKGGTDSYLCTFMIQIAVISNHQNGRDTHMRQIRIHSPTAETHYPLEQHGTFSTIEFQQYRTIR
ncbi:anaphase-promoting complex subunit 10 [Anopheles aquasalis]|uniref:Anaphase-promoting complex subunit 10 n=1 Tax=Anopheles albimanus TaxID=7167 RepID=A0A182FVD3_ANOAL|nr:anaphase-promoting complex subunit 10-like [Anopheles albimanus]XP_050093446.1 anaphase-promoting complex subunit 10 [Anopheles aquasalis]